MNGVANGLCCLVGDRWTEIDKVLALAIFRSSRLKWLSSVSDHLPSSITPAFSHASVLEHPSHRRHGSACHRKLHYWNRSCAHPIATAEPLINGDRVFTQVIPRILLASQLPAMSRCRKIHH